MTPTCRGIDLSNLQGPQNWERHRQDGVQFAFLKASEGEHTADPRFPVHMRDASAAGIPVLGGYHFAWPNTSAQRNADNYIRAVAPFTAHRGFAHWLDLEPYPDERNWRGTSAAGRQHWVVDWLAAVHLAFPNQPVGVYGGGAMDDEIPLTFTFSTNGHPVVVNRWYPAYPFRLLNPSYAQAEARPRPVRSGRPVQFWQFCGLGHLDRSLWYGSLADLERWSAGMGPAPAVPPGPKPKPKPPAGRARTVTVRAGQTLGVIALALGVSVTALAHYNHIPDPNKIYPGQVLTVPPIAPRPAPSRRPPAPAKPPAYTTYTVRQHDTLSGIAAAHGVKDWHVLATFNHLTNPDRLTPGQTIRIPKGH